MAFRDIVELNLEDNPAQLLRALGLASKQFEKVKQNIMIRIISRPEIQMIVLEFRRGEGLYYGEIKRGDTESYRQTQEQRSQVSGESAGEIRIDLRSQRLAEMMGYSLVRPLSPGGDLSNFYVVQLPNDPNIRPKPIDGITNYGVSPIRMRR